METECTQLAWGFQGLGRRAVVAQFDGGTITSDGGGLLLREVEQRTRIMERFAACFTDHRRPEYIEHTVGELVAQRVYGLALGYEDLNDHDELRRDPLLAVLVGQGGSAGQARARGRRSRGKALAGKSTLNRLELTPAGAGGGSAVQEDRRRTPTAVDRLLVDVFLRGPRRSRRSGSCWTWTPPTIRCTGSRRGGSSTATTATTATCRCTSSAASTCWWRGCGRPNIEAAAGAVEELERHRDADPAALAAGEDRACAATAGFCREALMAWCEAQTEVDLRVRPGAATRAWSGRCRPELAQAQQQCAATSAGGAACFTEFAYQTRESWSRARRVIGKAEHLAKGANPRFVVTIARGRARIRASTLYEQVYCARGDMENRIKEQQLALFADRTSTRDAARQPVAAVLLLGGLRADAGAAPPGTGGHRAGHARSATPSALKLLKIGAQIRVTVRKVWVALSSAYPYQALFAHVLARLHALPVPARAP